MSDDPAEDMVATEIRRRRRAAGLSQRALAKRAGFSRQYVSRAENPEQGHQSENLIAVLDAALNADGELLDLWRRAADERLHRRHKLAHSARTTPLADHAADGGSGHQATTGIAPPAADVRGTKAAPPVEPAAVAMPPLPAHDKGSANAMSASAALLADLTAADLDQLTVEDIEERVDALAKGYFRAGPTAFRSAVVQLRERVAGLMLVRSTSAQRRRLYAALAALTGMIAESSFAVGDHTDIHCTTAIALAEEAGRADLIAWVRGTQAQIALHTGNPIGALRYARAGQATAPCGSTAAVRSMAYLARASARTGDHVAAREAFRSAQGPWERLDSALTDSVFSLSADYLSYCELTVLAWLGEVEPARRLADRVDLTAESPTVGRAITQTDVGLVRLLSGEVEEAAHAGHRALSIGASRMTTPLRDRMTDLVESLAPFDVPAVHELRRRWTWISA